MNRQKMLNMMHFEGESTYVPSDMPAYFPVGIPWIDKRNLLNAQSIGKQYLFGDIYNSHEEWRVY